MLAESDPLRNKAVFGVRSPILPSWDGRVMPRFEKRRVVKLAGRRQIERFLYAGGNKPLQSNVTNKRYVQASLEKK